MGRKLADLWRYAGREDKGFKCEFCEQFFKGGIVRLRSHLSGSRGQGIKVCNKVSKEAKTAALAKLEAANNKPFMKKTKPETSSSNSDGISVTLNENCRDKVDNLLAKFFEENGIHSSIVESPSFINLVNALLKPGFSNYVLPSCSTLENQLIPCIRQEVEQYVSTAKQSWKATGCTVIIDSWSNEKEKRSFISIIACANKMTVLVNTFEIPNDDLICVFLETIVHSVVGSIGVDCIVQCIVDDSPFGEVFSEFLARKCPRLCIIRCANRELQSFFYEVEKEVEWIRTTFETANSLVDSICKEDDLLGLKQCSLGYDTLESILERKVELIKLVQSPEWLGQRESAKKVTEIIANQEFWKQGEEIQMVLNPLSKILHFDDAFDSGFGYLYGLVKIASQAIASLHTENPVKYQKLWDMFESKKEKIMNQTHKVAAFLNPAYMCSQIVQESETEEAINYMLEKFVCGDDKVGFVKDAIHYRRTLSNTTQQFKIIAAKASIPCEWWNEFGREFSVLSKYAVRILSQPCGSSSLKSSLSSFRANQIKHRGFMPDLNALNLRINHFLMDKFSAEKASQSKIINFEEFRQHKAMDDGSRNQVMEEARHSDEDTSLLLTSEEFIRSNGMKICFETTIASPITVGQKVEGEQGSPIHVYLVDSVTNCVVQLPSMLTLTVSVLDGDFTNEGLSSSSSSSSSDDGLCWTREHFDSNDLSSTMAAPLVTGDLQVMLQQGMGILGNFSFNYSSRDTRSGKFRLAVKTDAGNCQGIRTLEGISNAFVVEDCEVTPNQHLPTYEFNVPKDSASSFNIFESIENWEPVQSVLMHSDSSGSPGVWTPRHLWNNQLQWNTKSLIQTAARKIKGKALKWSRMKKMRSDQKTVGEEERETTVETTVSGDHDQVPLNTKNNVDHQMHCSLSLKRRLEECERLEHPPSLDVLKPKQSGKSEESCVKKEEITKDNKLNLDSNDIDINKIYKRSQSINKPAKTFKFIELKTATCNFRKDLFIGEGGFGKVYKGRLEKSNQEVAIKQLDHNGPQGTKEFFVEVMTLSLVDHPNLVKLIGCCAERDHKLLVYEYMPLGSLETHLHDLSPRRKGLDWRARMKIAAGAARGIEYLHDKLDPPIIYRDLKCSNILLGEGYYPKLSDFGLAKVGPSGDRTHVSTRVMGTYGYCAPDYAMTGQLTVKSDIYSFGVVLLELITGRKAFDPVKDPKEQNLIAWARPLFKDQSKFAMIADPKLEGKYPVRGLYQALAISAMCLQEQPSMRPVITDVVTALNYLASQKYDPTIQGRSQDG